MTETQCKVKFFSTLNRQWQVTDYLGTVEYQKRRKTQTKYSVNDVRAKFFTKIKLKYQEFDIHPDQNNIQYLLTEYVKICQRMSQLDGKPVEQHMKPLYPLSFMFLTYYFYLNDLFAIVCSSFYLSIQCIIM